MNEHHCEMKDDATEPCTTEYDATEPCTTEHAPQFEAELRSDDRERYSRHILLPHIGIEGQKKLKAAHVLVIGAGGLGCPVLANLATAGVGTIGIIDHDTVELSNLQRQFLHTTDSIGRLKTCSAQNALTALNPHITVNTYPQRLDPHNAETLLANYNLIVDCSDNFETRYLINDTAHKLNLPSVWGAALGFEGYLSITQPGHGPSYRDFFPEPPESATRCSTDGILNTVCHTIGSLMATEVIKLITGAGTTLVGKLLMFNAMDMAWRTYTFDSTAVAVTLTAPATVPVPATAPVPTPATATAPVTAAVTTTPSIHISSQQFAQEHANVFIIDVRNLSEPESPFPAVHRIPLPLFESGDAQSMIPRNKPLVVMCARGIRSLRAAEILIRDGFTNVRSLEGGLAAWEHAHPF